MVSKATWGASLARGAGDVLVESLLAAAMLSAMNALASLKLGAGELAMMATCWVAGLALSQIIRRQFVTSRWLLVALEWGGPVVLLELINGRFPHALTFAQITYAASLIMVLVHGWRRWIGRCERSKLDRHAESLRVMLVAAAAGWTVLPFFTDRLLGGTDARWYGGMFTDFVQQIRAGVFPIFVGQGEYAFNGSLNLFRSAPICLWIGGVWDWVTLQALTPLALQHLSLITSALAGALGMYAALILLVHDSDSTAKISSWQRWLAALIAALYPLCPGVLTTIYWYELQMTFTAVAFLPWVFYGNARTLLHPDTRGYGILAAALVLTWMSHAPLAMICTLLTAALQLGRLIFDSSNLAQWRAAAIGAVLFILLGAFYFRGTGELPIQNLQSLLYREGVLLVGITLVIAGIVRGIAWRQWWALSVAAGGTGLIWLGLPAWVCWAVGFALAFVLLVEFSEYLWPGLAGKQTPQIAVLAMLISTALAHYGAARFGFRPQELLLAGLKSNAEVGVGFFLPRAFSPDANLLSNNQPGAALWTLMVVGIVGGIWLRNRALAVLSIGAIPLVLLLVPLPWVSDFVTGFAPLQISTMIAIPLPYRLVPPMAAMSAMAGFLALLLASRLRPVWGQLAVLLLLLGVGWSVWDARALVARGWRITATAATTESYLNRDNYALGRYSYVLTPIPAYFSNGRQDPQLETRLLNAKGEVVIGPDEIARCCEQLGSNVVSLRSQAMPNAPEWLQIVPTLTVEPGECLLLRFEFPPDVDYSGWLIFSGDRNYREYNLLNEPTCPRGFGTDPQASRVVAFSNNGNSRETYRISVKMESGNSMPKDGSIWAKVIISHYQKDWVPVRTESLIPYYRAWLSANEAGFVETPRIWVPGYRAWVDGKPRKVLQSPQHLVMVPIAAGTHTVEVKFVGSMRLWTGFIISALTWVGLAFWFGGVRLRRWWGRGWGQLRKTGQHLVLARKTQGACIVVNYRILLAFVLLASFGLRIALAARGGEGYWPDEGRYGRSGLIIEAVARNDWRVAADTLLGWADHTLFSVIGLPPALLQYVVKTTPAILAAYFCLFSVLAIWLIWKVALAAGANERESFIAASLAACSSSLLIYSRHFLPYDSSLCLMLGALYLAQRPWSPGRAFSVGALCGAGFLVYNGYWLFGSAILGIYSIAGSGGRDLAKRAITSGVGLIAPIALVAGTATWLGHDLVGSFFTNADKISQGDYGLGYRVLAGYLWYAEGVFCLLYFVALVCAIRRIFRGQAEARLKWWAGLILLVGAGLIGLSDITHVFVVYGRLVHCLVPCLCLISAYWLEVCARHYACTWRSWMVFGVAVLVVAGLNFAEPLRLVFPLDFKQLAAEEARRGQKEAPAIYQMMHAEHLWQVSLERPLPPYDVLMRRSHPLEYRPYQYEGFPAEQRADLRRHDISMQLIRLRPEAGSHPPWSQAGDIFWGEYPGPLRLEMSFPRGRQGTTEPLLTTGCSGMGDTLYVKYLDDHRICFGLDHWGVGGVVSPPLQIDFDQKHEVIVSLGSIMPAGNAGIYQEQPLDIHLKDWLLVALDGRVVISTYALSYFSTPEEIFIGSNFIGGSVARENFTGHVQQISRASFQQVARFVPPLASALAGRDSPWEGASGPMEMELTMPREPVSGRWPLVTTGHADDADLLFIQRDAEGKVIFGLDQSGVDLVRSNPLPVTAEPLRIVFSLGSLMPPASSTLYSLHPTWSILRSMAYVELNGARVFSSLQRFDPAGRSVVFGANTIGAAATEKYFAGNVLRIDKADPQQVMASSLLGFISTGSPGADWLDYPGPLQLRLKFPQNRTQQAEPLLVNGITGAADFLFVHYLDERHIRLGFDHWGLGGPVSPPLEIDLGVEHELIVGVGFLMPPAATILYEHHPQLRRLQTLLYVELDGRTVIEGASPVYAGDPTQIGLGVNLVGGSSAGPAFTGSFLKLTHIAPESILAHFPDNSP